MLSLSVWRWVDCECLLHRSWAPICRELVDVDVAGQIAIRAIKNNDIHLQISNFKHFGLNSDLSGGQNLNWKVSTYHDGATDKMYS